MQQQVEILMATYNGEKYIEQQLESLFNQTYTHWILTIRDDGSTDNTVLLVEKYIQKYPGKIKLLPAGKKNLRSTLNFGKLLEASTLDHVMLCDQDDYWFPNKIELTLHEMLKREKQYGKECPLIIYTDLSVADESLNLLHNSYWKLRKQSPEITEKLYKTIAHSTITGCTMMINRAGIKLSTPILMDNFQHDHWMAMHVVHFGHIVAVNQPTLLYRQHSLQSVGAQTFSFSYLLSRLSYFPRLIRDWILLKKTKRIPVPLVKVFLFKVYYNVVRMF